jgi:hypothetical protein
MDMVFRLTGWFLSVLLTPEVDKTHVGRDGNERDSRVVAHNCANACILILRGGGANESLNMRVCLRWRSRVG